MFLEKFIKVNTKFHKSRRKSRSSRKYILVDATYTNFYALTVILKIASAVSEILDMNIMILSPLRANRKVIKFIKSFYPKLIISQKKMLLYGLIWNWIRVTKWTISIKTGKDLVGFSDESNAIGKHIYDITLRRRFLTTVEKLDIRNKIDVFYGLLFYYSIKDFLKRKSASFIILVEPAFKNAIISEILKKEKIPFISGIELNGIMMHKFTEKSDYLYHCRRPDFELVEKIMHEPALMQRAEEYLARRLRGEEQQHDVIRAYAKNKKRIGRNELISTYTLKDNRRIVLVMAHVFCDAPHIYPNMLFQDFKDWLVKTCLRLARNECIDFVVKEHPSAGLYGEEGETSKVLRKYGFHEKVLSNDIITSCFFKHVDVVVTCAGTAGIEFPCHGVPVLIGAKAPYASSSYVRVPDSITQYYEEIDRIHEYSRVSSERVKMAKALLFLTQEVMKVPKTDLGFGTQEYFKGCSFDEDKFVAEMIEECLSGRGYEALMDVIRTFLNGKYKNLINLKKVNILKNNL